MTLCESLEQQRSVLEANLAAVDTAIAQTTDPRQLQRLLFQQAQLRAQLAHVESLINQNCTGAPVALAAREPAASAEKQRSSARKEHVKALQGLTASSVSFSKAELRAHRLPAAPARKPTKKTVNKPAAAKKSGGKKGR